MTACPGVMSPSSDPPGYALHQLRQRGGDGAVACGRGGRGSSDLPDAWFCSGFDEIRLVDVRITVVQLECHLSNSLDMRRNAAKAANRNVLTSVKPEECRKI